MPFPVTERYHAAVVTMPAEFVGGAQGPVLHETLDGLAASGQTNVVLDFAGTTFMDSSGLGALLEAMHRLRTKGGDLRMAAMESSPRLIWMVSVSRLHDVFKLHPTVEEAAKSFAADASPSDAR